MQNLSFTYEVSFERVVNRSHNRAIESFKFWTNSIKSIKLYKGSSAHTFAAQSAFQLKTKQTEIIREKIQPIILILPLPPWTNTTHDPTHHECLWNKLKAWLCCEDYIKLGISSYQEQAQPQEHHHSTYLHQDSNGGVSHCRESAMLDPPAPARVTTAATIPNQTSNPWHKKSPKWKFAQ